jgi:RNA polymerase sigma-70 factor (ECF subfamily)
MSPHRPTSIPPEPENRHGNSPEDFFRRERPVVYRLCFGFLLDSAEADDAAQEALLKLHDSLSSFDRSKSWESWRNSVVWNHCRDRLRKARVRKKAEARSALPSRDEIDPAPGPEGAYASAESIALLRAALGSLSEREREVFVLRDLEGQESREVAAVLGITEGTVRSLLCLARKRLRETLTVTATGLAARADSGGRR